MNLPNPIYSQSGLHSARILKDSFFAGNRLTTFEIMFPRIVLAEFNTHRIFSRNSGSSRAIPVSKMIKMVLERGYIPWHWGKNQKGMQAEEEITDLDQIGRLRMLWGLGTGHAVEVASALSEEGVHKQITNRLLEPFMLHTVIVTATEWSNFFNLRAHPEAHPDIEAVAQLMKGLYAQGTPKELEPNEWHLPLILDEEYDELDIEDLIKVSIGRCARVSYLTHDGRRDFAADIELFERLFTSGHMSPFEHAARGSLPGDVYRGLIPVRDIVVDPDTLFQIAPHKVWYGNFKGFVQYRKTIDHEEDMLGLRGTAS